MSSFPSIRALISKGLLHLVGDSSLVQKVQGEFHAGEVLSGLERYQDYGLTSVPLAGMELLTAFIGGDRSHGVVIAVADRQYRLKNLVAGEVALYDDQGQSVHLTRDGIVIRGANKPITLTGAPKIRCETELFEVTGQIKDLCETQGQTMAAMRETYNRHTHTENDSHSQTEVPLERMGG